MKLPLATLLTCILLAPASAQSELKGRVTPCAESAACEADVLNYLTTRLRIAKRGEAFEELKAEVTNEVDFTELPPRSVELLRRFVLLSDHALEAQAKFQGRLGELDQQIAQAESKQALGLLGVFAGVMSGGALLPALTGLGAVATSEGPYAARAALLASSTIELRSEITAFEFDLALLRAELLRGGKVDASRFIGPADYDRFLAAASNPNEEERIAAIAAALERSPALQPAALHLCAHFYEKDNAVRCREYADKAITSAPRFLRRDLLRSQAYAHKAYLAFREENYASTVDLAYLGLVDDPASAPLLNAMALGLLHSGKYADALPLLEKLVLLAPRDASVRYNLACCYARERRDPDAALATLQAALDRGFNQITHAKADLDLQSLRKERAVEFEEMMALRLDVRLVTMFLFPDQLEFENTSRFALDHLSVVVRITPSGRKSTPVEKKFDLGGLASGESKRVTSPVNSTQPGFAELFLVAESPQGRFEAVIPRAKLASK